MLVDECSLLVYADRSLPAHEVDRLRRLVRKELFRAARRIRRRTRVGVTVQ